MARPKLKFPAEETLITQTLVPIVKKYPAFIEPEDSSPY
jgi:hypothetical protein